MASIATDPVISVHGLVKTFGRTRALDGLDLEVRPGGGAWVPGSERGREVDHDPCAARAAADRRRNGQVFGLDPWRDAVSIHRRLAYVPGDVALWPNLSGGETIDMLTRMRGAVPDPARRQELLERFSLDPTKKGRAYSKGNRQKVALVAAFATDSELLVLDEPTSGLDPLMEQVFNECVAEHTDPRGYGAAVEPHPQRGGAARRASDDHPRRQDHRGRRPEGHAAPASQQGPGGGHVGAPGSLRDPRRSRLHRRRAAGELLGQPGGSPRGPHRPDPSRRAVAHQHAALARGALPGRLPLLSGRGPRAEATTS